ncbi:MAG: hypothetical protein ACJAXZ_004565 [Akkermansiaceae bacterium]|jgi:hypothetical protein
MGIFRKWKSNTVSEHQFYGALYIDYKTAIKGDPTKQNYCAGPRDWYMDADFSCAGCSTEFTWTALEQKVWFEDYFFWVNSQPRNCKKCYAIKRRLARLQKEYNTIVTDAKRKGNIELKHRVIELVSELDKAISNLPTKMIDTKELFMQQVTKP